VQRLFSTFAGGWPGAGLLGQRVLTCVFLLCAAVTHVVEPNRSGLGPSVPYVIAAVAGVFLLVGLWTPIAGMAIAIVEVWIFWEWSGPSLMPIVLAVLGGTVAMIGPGMWSMDAKLYGRKHLEDPRY
jgi:putative oxidoreductase